ncbi:hypothetical protein [Streptomyces malaysiensis]|uniref:Uncharacterized protein n=1 Tax=Streptomyces malaysiensis TaxID=92644 RepID=A0A2J7Z8I2_STRMQ|nr:hypothetical protein [Streptomyces malaysiensis]PNG96565.1 hypothetical protein SMF913_12590 [Streptomyces malaysiensis]
MRRGIARAQAESGTLLLQIVHRESRALATVVQHPCKDIQDAYDKAASDMPQGDIVCYFVLATEPALRRAEAAGVPYMRAYHGVHVSGAILRLPASLWTEQADV